MVTGERRNSCAKLLTDKPTCECIWSNFWQPPMHIIAFKKYILFFFLLKAFVFVHIIAHMYFQGSWQSSMLHFKRQRYTSKEYGHTTTSTKRTHTSRMLWQISQKYFSNGKWKKESKNKTLWCELNEFQMPEWIASGQRVATATALKSAFCFDFLEVA